MSSDVTALVAGAPAFDPAGPLVASGNLRRRSAISRAIQFGASLSALCAVLLLGDVVYTVVSHGAPAVTFDFLTTNPAGLAGGGIANALLGTAVIVAFAALIAVPVGVLIGLYLTEFSDPTSRTGQVLKLVLDLLQGLPTIIVGVVVFGLLVATTHVESGFAGSVALAIVMLPLIARSSQEVLLLVPRSLREAADALGVERWRVGAQRRVTRRHQRDRDRRDSLDRAGGRRDGPPAVRRQHLQPDLDPADAVRTRGAKHPDLHSHDL